MRSSWKTCGFARGETDRGDYCDATQIAAIDNSDLAIMAHHPILDHNDTAALQDHQPNSGGQGTEYRRLEDCLL
jgi:hypothetical protein